MAAYTSWIGLGSVLFAFALYTGVTSGIITNDESWFLQVVRRMTNGEVLYRDIFFGLTPLSAYLAAGLVSLFGVEVLVVRGLMALCGAATSLLALRIARQLEMGLAAQALVVLALLAFVPSWLPGVGSPYTPLAYIFLLVTLSAVLGWRDNIRFEASRPVGRGIRSVAFAGAWAGLAFATKQTIGLYALAGLWIVVWLGAPHAEMPAPKKLKAVFVATGAFALLTVLLLLPVFLSGGTEKFLEYGFLNRLEYTQAAQIPYWAGLEQMLRLLFQPKLPRDLLFGYWNIQFLFPLAAFPAMAWVWLRSSDARRERASALLAFSAAAFAGAFPRADLPHVAPTLAPTLLALGWGLQTMIGPRAEKALRGVVVLSAIFFGLGIAGLLIRPVRWALLGAHSLCPIPYFRGIILEESFCVALLHDRGDLQAATLGEGVFMLAPHASLLYLAFDRNNPMPYDYPLVTSFGFRGQEEVIEAIESCEIRWVCLVPLGPDPLAPATLEAYVQGEMQAVRDLSRCRLYRSEP